MPADGADRRFMAMPAYVGGHTQMAGVKWYGSNVENKKKGLPRSILMLTLNDKDTGAPVAFMSANLISSYRTGAVPAVGVKHLARKGAHVLGVVGPGVMNKTSLRGFMAVCPGIDTIKIKGRGQASIDSYIDMSRRISRRSRTLRSCPRSRKPCAAATSSASRRTAWAALRRIRLSRNPGSSPAPCCACRATAT